MSLIHTLNAIKMQTQQVKSITEHLDYIKTTSKQFDEISCIIDALIRNNKRSTGSRRLSTFKDKKKLSEAAETAYKEIEALNAQIEQLAIVSAKIKVLNNKINELFNLFFGDNDKEENQS